MPIDLYYMHMSAPCHAVRLVATALGVDLNLKTLNLMAGEHLKPKFLKINPQHTMPTMDDKGNDSNTFFLIKKGIILLIVRYFMRFHLQIQNCMNKIENSRLFAESFEAITESIVKSG